MKNENINYERAFSELKEIINEIENGNVNIDILSIKVKRAGFLIQFCQNKLKETELDIEKILKEMNSLE